MLLVGVPDGGFQLGKPVPYRGRGKVLIVNFVLVCHLRHVLKHRCLYLVDKVGEVLGGFVAVLEVRQAVFKVQGYRSGEWESWLLES